MSALSRRSDRTALAAFAATLAIAAVPALATAQPAADPGLPAAGHGVPAVTGVTPGSDAAQLRRTPVVNARGTDVAAQDQRTEPAVVDAAGTDVAAPDQQVPITVDPAPISSAAPSDDPFPTVLVLALAAFGLTFAGVALGSRSAVTRRRSRAAA